MRIAKSLRAGTVVAALSAAVASGWLGCSPSEDPELWKARIDSDYPPVEVWLEELQRDDRESRIEMGSRGDSAAGSVLCLLEELTRARGFDRYYPVKEENRFLHLPSQFDRSRGRVAFLAPGEPVPRHPTPGKSHPVMEVHPEPASACNGAIWRSLRKPAEDRRGPEGSTEIAHDTFESILRPATILKRSGGHVTAEFGSRGKDDALGAVGVSAEGYRRVFLTSYRERYLPPRAGVLYLEVRLLTEDFTGTSELVLSSVADGEWQTLGREGAKIPSSESDQWETRIIEATIPNEQRWDSIRAEVFIEGQGTLWVDDLKLYFRDPAS